MQAVFGFKQRQSQVFLEDGTRVPVTVVSVKDNVVTQHKTEEKEGYTAVQIGIGTSKKNPKSLMGHLKKANLRNAPSYIREVRVNSDDIASLTLGSSLSLSEILQPGDMVSVTGVSKGKGFAGGVKRYGFRGGPKTHGQSDRHRAPGSIGQGTTPGRVYKGKRMAGHMGNEQVTVTNLYVIDVQGEEVYVSGLIPGGKNTLIRIEKIGEKKNFVPIFKEKTEEPQEETAQAKETTEESEPKEETAKTETEEVKMKDAADETPAETKPTEEVTTEEAASDKADESEAASDEKSEKEGTDGTK